MKTYCGGKREDGKTRRRGGGTFVRRSSWLSRLAVGLVVAELTGLVGVASAAEQRSSLTILTNGSCIARYESTQTRLLAEQQMKAWERYERQTNAGEDDSDGAPPKPA